MVILYCHNYLISLVRLDRQRKLLMRTDVKRREIWEWSDHTPILLSLSRKLSNFSKLILSRQRHFRVLIRFAHGESRLSGRKR